ncbi:ATP-binding protein [Streptomyces antimycoticus]|uniref:ATP-binding protein n=1 Tax=Streptomyces antimycoticus TaxID=68175 RepID=UPI00280ABFB1|nr:ATP-binding protein [Streptomyces antimycoticus]
MVHRPGGTPVSTTATRANTIGTPRYSETYRCEEESSRRARQLVMAALHAWGLDTLAENAALITAELVANAVRHSESRMLRVSVARPREGLVRVAVADKSRQLPVVRDPTPEESSGRGLLLVSVLASRWNTDLRRWGKVVWAELGTDEKRRDGST